MALPSQRMRHGLTPRFTVSKRKPLGRRRLQRRIIGSGVVVLALLATWVIWSGAGPKKAQANALATETKTPAQPESSVAEKKKTTTTPPAPAPTSKQTKPQDTIAASDTPRVEVQVAKEPQPLPTVKLDPVPPSLTMGEPAAKPQDTALAADSTLPRPASNTPTNASTPTAPAPAQAAPQTASDDHFTRAREALAQNRPVQARELLNRALHDSATPPAQRAEARRELAKITDLLFFSNKVIPGDELCRVYKVEQGDLLSTIPRKQTLHIEYQLLQRLNGIDDPRKLRLGQQLKVVQGPFHAVIDKSEFRLDLYADERDASGNRMFLRSFDVGLGEFGSTPVGAWVVANSKVINPGWTNPRTYKTYSPGDPENPIGNRWIGLEGTDDTTRALPSYGIHGTIDPDSIGKEASMGCVRLREGEIEVLYELLMPQVSEVLIVE